MESLNWRGHPSVHSIDLDFHASPDDDDVIIIIPKIEEFAKIANLFLSAHARNKNINIYINVSASIMFFKVAIPVEWLLSIFGIITHISIE